MLIIFFFFVITEEIHKGMMGNTESQGQRPWICCSHLRGACVILILDAWPPSTGMKKGHSDTGPGLGFSERPGSKEFKLESENENNSVGFL